MIVLLCAPCNGFGDIVAAAKVHDILVRHTREPVHIVTTQPGKFATLGIRGFVHAFRTPGPDQCRRFRHMDAPALVRSARVVVNVPLQADFAMQSSDLRAVVGPGPRLLTLSEYNHPGVTASTPGALALGLGPGHVGALPPAIPTGASVRRVVRALGAFTICYIGGGIMDPGAKFAVELYLGRLARWAGERRIARLSVLAEPWMAEALPRWTARDPALAGVRLRTDVFPVPHRRMLAMWAGVSAPPLCTGDQTVSDALFLVPRALPIYYHVANWKQELGEQLAAHFCGVDVIRHATHPKRMTLIGIPAPRRRTPDATGAIVRAVTERPGGAERASTMRP